MKINFIVNDKNVTLESPPLKTLLDVLRQNLHLTGTKEGCGKGECGACTVLIDGKPSPSCIVPISQMEGRKITTIEGLEKNGKLGTIQQSFINEGAVQCGFCIPGMILSSKALLAQNPSPSEEEIKEALSGNLCRCTGYVKIISAIKKASKMINK